MPSSHATSGVSGADFVLYVTMRPTQGNTIAWASGCREDQYNCPIAGQANFGPNAMSVSSADLSSMVATAVHEISHALGFSSSKFSEFRDASGTVRTNVIARISQVGHHVL